MKVLLENKFHYLRGGSEAYYFNLADGLRQRGHEVVFFAMEDPRNEPCAQEGYFVRHRDYNGKTSLAEKASDAMSLVYSREAKERFEALLEAERPDIIHLNLVHRQITFSILDAPAARDIPVVYTAHDYVMVCPSGLMLDNDKNVCDLCVGGHFRHCLEKGCVKNSRAKSALAVIEAESIRRRGSYHKIDRIIAPSSCMQRTLMEAGFPGSQVITMRNFASEESMALAHDAGDDTDHDHPYFLYFGRLSREKGITLLVDAFLSVADKLPRGWRLVIVGEGPAEQDVRDRLVDSPYASSVSLLGYKQGPELRDLVSRASYSVLYSRCWENMPYSILESLAAGTPVIGADIGGIPELVTTGDEGFLAKPDCVRSLGATMIEAVSMTGGEYHAMQSRCKKVIIEECGRDTYLDGLIGMYQELLEHEAR